ncbi:histidine--tRNA ligase [bacterium]|jgi:histidyl-tRNA synthetase|nr:histidine--tRNA ligase [bacterium]|tara:strand:+ start:222 stop:1469 length:1248 start_codon:yes stop_codon:yes gene_type:complete
MASFQTPRGTVDYLPDKTPLWQKIERTARHIFELYNYQEIKTPIFESTDLFTSSIGGDTDIVSKEMYTFLDKKGRSLTLRPEGTAAIARAYIQHALHRKGNHHLLFYVGPMFRYERPQAGRFRQFTQIGVENIGSPDPACDAEVIIMGIKLFKTLGITDIVPQLNTVGCPICRPVIEERLKQFLESSLTALCGDCQTRFDTNPLRILDCKKNSCTPYFSAMPDIRQSICQSCHDHFDQVLTYLDTHGVTFEINPNLVRGLDYYNRTAFELVSKHLGSQNAVCGGGRYDSLISRLGGPSSPAVGFAFGMERLMALVNSDIPPVPMVYIGCLDPNQYSICFSLTHQLRDRGIKAINHLDALSTNGHLKRASKSNAAIPVIIQASGQCAIVYSSTPTSVPVTSLLAHLVELAPQHPMM